MTSGVRPRWIGVLALASIAAGCGGSGADHISDGAQQRLESGVASVRRAAETFDPAGAAAALTELRRDVTQLERRGDLGEGRALRLLAIAARVEARLASVPTTTTTTTAPVRSDDDGKGNGNEGKGKGKDDDD